MREDENNGEEIVLRGEVIDLRPERGQHPHQKWLVTLRVDAVVTGTFSEPSFSFHIHSPTKSSIALGGRYLIHLARSQDGAYLLKRIEPSRD